MSTGRKPTVNETLEGIGAQVAAITGQQAEVLERIDEAIRAIGMLNESAAVARTNHQHSERRFNSLESTIQQQQGRIEEMARQKSDMSQQIATLTVSMNNFEKTLPLSIQTAISAALHPLAVRQAHDTGEKSVVMRVAKAIGNGGWAVILLILTAAFTPALDRLFGASEPPPKADHRSAPK